MKCNDEKAWREERNKKISELLKQNITDENIILNRLYPNGFRTVKIRSAAIGALRKTIKKINEQAKNFS